jgi:hypothetical protein
VRARRALVVVAVIAMCIGAACSGDDSSTSKSEQIKKNVEAGNNSSTTRPAHGLPDPCALVTRADAEKLFRTDATQQPDDSPVHLGKSCSWESPSETGQVGHLLQVHVYNGTEFYGKSQFDTVEPVPGLGDDAFVNTGSSSLEGVTVGFLHGNLTVTILYTAFTAGVSAEERVNAVDRKDDVIAIAKQADSRI